MANKKYNTEEEKQAAIKLRKKEYYEKNKAHLRELHKKWVENNKDKVSISNKKFNKIYYDKNKEKSNEVSKEYYNKNKETINNRNNEYYKDRRKTDPLFRFKINVRSKINKELKNNNTLKIDKTEIILGCSYNDFKIYLESKFEPWMTWENRGLYNGELNYGWDVDHIIPLSTATKIEDVSKLLHYTNCQPLCSKINRDIKKNNVDY